MASREGDTALWLHNKLGSADDLWSASGFCSQLNKDKLQSIQDCFHNLQPYVKVKLLHSFLHLPKRNIDDWRPELDEIVNMAQDDTDQWVAVVANILKNFPSSGSMNSEVDEHHNFFHEALNDLKKLVRKSTETDMPPLECLYLGRSALNSVAGPPTAPVKHFALKRKPKSASLRADLLQKSVEAANNLKKTGTSSSIPVKFRSFAKKMDDTTPMRGIPNKATAGGFLKAGTLARSIGGNASHRSLASRREGGIKILDIAEQPLVGREAKRRRRQLEQEAMEKQRQAAAERNNATPDYAVNLVSLQTPKQETKPITIARVVSSGAVVASSTTQPSYLPAGTRILQAATPVQVSVPSTDQKPTITVRVSGGSQQLKQELLTPIAPAPTATTRLQTPPLQAQPPQQIRFVVAATSGSATGTRPMLVPRAIMSTTAAATRLGVAAGTGSGAAAATSAAAATRPITIRTLPPGAQIVSARGATGGTTLLRPGAVTTATIRPTATIVQQVRPGAGGAAGAQQILLRTPAANTVLSQAAGGAGAAAAGVTGLQSIVRVQAPVAGAGGDVQQVNAQTLVGAVGAPVGAPAGTNAAAQAQLNAGAPAAAAALAAQVSQRRGLSLTREQMLQAQDMFRQSNKVTRPEKALILGFMAGSRDNPCPQQGDIVNIRLSENMDSIQQPDLTFRPMMVDVYFQMNYSTGEWKRIKKYRDIEPE